MWTTNQKAAIDAPCADNIVSAAAGSGKTAVLVQRIIGRVLSAEVDIDRLLVVTFTNAAASEMKSRLMKEIMKELNTSKNSDHLNRQLMLINNASICTIDSFCLNVLRNNFYKLGLDPAIKVGDTAELELIKDDLLNEIIEYYYTIEDSVFLDIVNSYTGRKDTELSDLILQIFNFSLSLPEGMDDVYRLKNNFLNNSIWENCFVDKAHKISQKAISYYEKAIKIVSFSSDTEDNFRSLDAEKNYFENVLSASCWKDVRKAVLCFEFSRFTPHKSLSLSEKEDVKLYRNLAKDLYKTLKNDFSGDYSVIKEDIITTSVVLDKFIEITRLFAEKYASEKRSKGIVDFSDVEHLTLQLLKKGDGSQSDTAVGLMNKYDEIYVDEFQDCNSIQAEIFRLISRENVNKPNMFRVGDMKQSIYGFRGAQPVHFKEALRNCSSEDSDVVRNKIILNKNFRSRKGIIDAVNGVFEQIMSENLGDIDYTEDEFLYYNEDFYKDVNKDVNHVDFVLIDTQSDTFADANEENDIFGELKSIEAEAIYVANKIKEIVNSKDYLIFDKSTNNYRPARYSDIAILLRSGGEKAAAFNRILSIASIPVYCEMGEGYYNSPEVTFLTNFLKIIDNPYDDVALLSVMRHPVFGFSDDEFVSIRISKTKGYFYKSLLNYQKSNSDSLASKVKLFLDKMKHYYEKSKYLSCDRLLWNIIRDTDYMAYLSFTSNPDLRKANVKALLTRAYEFEKSSYKGIFDFIRYVDSVKKSNKDAEPAKTLSEDEDVVRIMTIHKSKGLEFPVVFLCNSTKQFNETDIRSNKILTHPTYGFGLNFYDFDNYYYYELPQKALLREVKRKEMLSEEMRVLYVALTRAREKLIITGAKKKAKEYRDKFFYSESEETVDFIRDMLSGAKSYSDWILGAISLNGNYSYSDSNHLFSIKIINKAELSLNVYEKTDEFSFDTSAVTSDIKEKVKTLLEYSYPHSGLSNIPSNMSVTELKRREMSQEESYMLFADTKIKTPDFYFENHKFSSADIGTFTHLVMEKLDFTSVSSPEEIKLQLKKLVDEGFLTADQANTVKSDNIYRILNTEVGKKLRSFSNTLKREFSFKYLMDASSLNKNIISDEKIVVQGMIDAYFEDSDGNVIIVDYKTDKVSNGPEEIRDRYLVQMKYYKIALEKVFEKNISEAYLFLLDSGDVVSCDI